MRFRKIHSSSKGREHLCELQTARRYPAPEKQSHPSASPLQLCSRLQKTTDKMTLAATVTYSDSAAKEGIRLQLLFQNTFCCFILHVFGVRNLSNSRSKEKNFLHPVLSQISHLISDSRCLLLMALQTLHSPMAEGDREQDGSSFIYSLK